MKKNEMMIWYEACDFIKREMQFFSIKDFWEHSKEIVSYFEKGNSYIKQLYQWYVFASPNLTKRQKEAVWDFITKKY